MEMVFVLYGSHLGLLKCSVLRVLLHVGTLLGVEAIFRGWFSHVE